MTREELREKVARAMSKSHYREEDGWREFVLLADAAISLVGRECAEVARFARKGGPLPKMPDGTLLCGWAQGDANDAAHAILALTQETA